MSVHPSLSSKGKRKRSRSVLKRFERLKELQKKKKWEPGDSVFGLPKVKALHWKIKKSKTKPTEAEAPSGEAVPEAAAGKLEPKKKEEVTKKK